LLLDEDRAALRELGDDVLVVDDLLAHVDRRPVDLERLLDRLHGTVAPRAVAARRGEQDALGSARGGGRAHRRRGYPGRPAQWRRSDGARSRRARSWPVQAGALASRSFVARSA